MYKIIAILFWEKHNFNEEKKSNDTAMNKKNNLVNRFSRMVASISILLVPFISSCVEEFKVSRTITETYDGEMVIHGRILAGEESVFHLSRTVPFSSDDPYPIIRDAQVSIIGENGFRS